MLMVLFKTFINAKTFENSPTFSKIANCDDYLVRDEIKIRVLKGIYVAVDYRTSDNLRRAT